MADGETIRNDCVHLISCASAMVDSKIVWKSSLSVGAGVIELCTNKLNSS